MDKEKLIKEAINEVLMQREAEMHLEAGLLDYITKLRTMLTSGGDNSLPTWLTTLFNAVRTITDPQLRTQILEAKKNWDALQINITAIMNIAKNPGQHQVAASKISMMSEIPINLQDVEGEDLDKEILRAGIIAEYDAINLYEQMAAITQDEVIQEVLLDVAKEEKTHVGEFQALLVQIDCEQATEMSEGAVEVEELFEEEM